MKKAFIVVVLGALILSLLVSLTIISAATGAKVQFFNGTTAASANTIAVNFKLMNTGSDAIPLSNVKLRYYFTNEGNQTDSFACDWLSATNVTATGAFVTITPVTNADRYLEVGFTGTGTLAAGAYVEVKGRVWKSDWSNFTQTNDFSFNASATNYVDASNITAYISGTLYWGTAPDGNPVTSTPTPTVSLTPTPTVSLTPTPTSQPSSTQAPTPTPTVRSGGAPYQAENASYGGSTVLETTNSGYNGTGYLNFPATGGYVEFLNVNGGNGGLYTLKFRNALGGTASRTGRYQVNGGTWQNITFNPTGAFTTWSVTSVTATLNSGIGNTVRLESTGQDLANIDELDLSAGGSTPTPTLRTNPTPTRFTGTTTVYLASDSTVQTYSSSYYPQAGWGQMIPNYFTTNVKFDNRAIGGRSSRTFVEEGRLDSILSVIKTNDYLFVQFGHNDATISKPERYCAPYTTYKEYLKKYVDGARAHGAIPVLITPVCRLNYKNGVFVNDFPDYCTAMKQVATENNCKIIDLMTKSLNYLTSIGYNQAYTLYMVSSNGTDYTHFTEKGATQMARLVAEGVKEINVPISQYVK